MKNLIILGILVFAACLGSSCQDVTIGFLQKPLQQQPRNQVDMAPMRTAFAAPALHCIAQNLHQQIVVFLLAVKPVGHQPQQLLLLGVQQNGV